jgi:hypothetical protein
MRRHGRLFALLVALACGLLVTGRAGSATNWPSSDPARSTHTYNYRHAAVSAPAASVLGINAAPVDTSARHVHNYDVSLLNAPEYSMAPANAAATSQTEPASLPTISGSRPSSLALVVAAESETTLYRAVSAAERADIKASGGFRQALSGEGYEGKLFATTAEDAARYGRINYGIGQEAFHVVDARVPTSFAESLYSGTSDSMRFVGVDPEQLAGFNRLARINIWDYVPLVAKP